MKSHPQAGKFLELFRQKHHRIPYPLPGTGDHPRDQRNARFCRRRPDHHDRRGYGTGCQRSAAGMIAIKTIPLAPTAAAGLALTLAPL